MDPSFHCATKGTPHLDFSAYPYPVVCSLSVRGTGKGKEGRRPRAGGELRQKFFFFRAALGAYGSSQARSLIGDVAAGLHHSHSNVGSQLHLQPTP